MRLVSAALVCSACLPAAAADPDAATLDFNRTHNPPRAVSEFTTCPIAPKRKVRVGAGEKYPGR